MTKFKKPFKFIGLILLVLFIVGIFFASRYIGAFNSFLDKITSRAPETKAYSVIVSATTAATELKDLKNTAIGFLSTDPHATNAEAELKSAPAFNNASFETSRMDDLNTLFGMLNSGILSALTLETDRLYALAETTEDPTRNLKTIYTFTIELEAEPLEPSTKNTEKDPFIVYISGSDSRTGLKTTARSDVNILAAIHPTDHKILLVSIPRDTYVQLHDTTGLRDKLTHAGIYGIQMSKTTIEDFLNIKIDHTIKVSFETVVKVVDELDGIEITSDQAMDLKPEGKNKVCHFIVGAQIVDGDCALRFARERKSYTTGDRHRGENQQQVIMSIVQKLATSRDYLLKLPSILDIAADSFETSFQKPEIITFIRHQIESPVDWQIESIAIDGSGSMQPTYSMGAHLPLYVMLPYPDSISTASAKITEYLSTKTE